MVTDIFTSIITPTYNRSRYLPALLESLESQTFDRRRFELLICDDGSTDDTEQLVRTWQVRASYSIRYLQQTNQGPGAARNLGMQHAAGRLFLFIDSDCQADRRWVERMVDAFECRGFDVAGGPDWAGDNSTSTQQAVDFVMTSFLTTGGMRGHSRRRLAKFYPRCHNMALSRVAFEKSGGFAPLRHGQDIELSYRVASGQGRVEHVHDALVCHQRRATLRQFARQLFNFGVARVNLWRLHPAMLEPLHVVPAILLVTGVVALSFTLVWPAWAKAMIALVTASAIGLGVWATIVKKKPATGILVCIVAPLQIASYGAGFLCALLIPSLGRKHFR